MPKEISQRDELAKARLRKELNRYKREHEVTNKEFAKTLSMSESLFSQYVNGKKPLTDKVVKLFSAALGVKEDIIQPRIYQKVTTMVPVIGSMTNELPGANCARIEIRDFKNGLVAVENNMIFTTDASKYGYIIIDTDTPPGQEDDVVYRRRDNPNFHIGKLKIFMRDLISIIDNNNQSIQLKMSELAWVGKVHEYVTLEL